MTIIHLHSRKLAPHFPHFVTWRSQEIKLSSFDLLQLFHSNNKAAFTNLMMSLVSSNHRWTWECLQPGLSCVWRGYWTSPQTVYWNVNMPVWLRTLPPPAYHPASGPEAPPPSQTRANPRPESDSTSCWNVTRGRRLTGLSMHTQSSNTPAR